MAVLSPLPIDPLLPEVVAKLRGSVSLVIEAPPGAGKTTRVPRALLDAGFAQDGEIVVLQPRRLPARMAAARVAEELGEAPGQTIGYTVRYEDVASARTRVRFVTEGVLTRRLLADPELRGVAAVVLDEFHERHLATDLGLALLAGLQRRRPELRLCVMSATLESEPVSGFLDGCPVLRSEGRLFPIELEYLPEPSTRPLAEQVSAAVRRLCREGLQGDVLVFLPGAGEIRRATEALAALTETHNLLVLPLHGDLSPAEQNRAVRPASQRKIILSTNVAETSVTIDGVVAVIDSGLARRAGFSPWTRLPTLMVADISQASAIQRAGRAGRTRPGRALRLYTRHDFEQRPRFDVPEIHRLDLAETLLALHALGIRSPQDFAWFEQPPAPAVAAGEELLRLLGAVNGQGAVTDLGAEMLRFPLHPRLARLVAEAARRGVGPEGADLAGLLSERDISASQRVGFGKGGRSGAGEGADVLERLDRFTQARASRFDRGKMRGLDLDPRAVEAADRASKQLRGNLSKSPVSPTRKPSTHQAMDEALAMATLAAFPDRVLRRRVPGGREAVLAGGGTAEVGLTPPEDLQVALDIEERGAGTSRGISVRLAVGIKPEWLIDLCATGVSEKDELVWNPDTARVDRVGRLGYGLITLDEARRPAEASHEASRILLQAARQAGPKAFGQGDGGGSGSLSMRLAELARALPEENIAPPGEAQQAEALAAACEGRTSFAELRESGSLSAELSPKIQILLRNEAPERLRLPGGREVPINYESDKPPWIESRLQDFFGMSRTPTICRGRVSLTVHLLAPNARAVQVTRDLPNFWRQHYPAIRKELSRRYPRHSWPEDGATAVPPPPRPPRR